MMLKNEYSLSILEGMAVEARVVNVVATAALGQKVELEELGKLKEVLHDPDVYGGVAAYLRSSDMSGKVIIFASGKMISIGTKSEEGAARELECAKRFLIQKGFVKPTVLKNKIENIVVVANFRKSIDLEKTAKKYKVIYEPDQFPGAILRVRDHYNATVLLFASGKAVVTGLKSSDEISPILRKITNVITD